MIRSFSLSLAAMDILWERLELGLPPFPFEVPHNGRTMEERANIRGAVHADLRRRNLMEGDRLDPDVEDALRALAQPQVALTVFGSLDRGAALLARVVRTGQNAILTVLIGQTLRFEYIRPGTIVQAMVGLIPDERPGPGQPVTLSLDGREPKTSAEIRTRAAAEAMFERPRIRVGQFGITVRGRHGREHRGPELGWFDTDAGRYSAQSRTEPDGQRWVTYAPADRARLGQLLHNHLATMQPSP
jgi:ESX secretion-associated protein EspG